MLHTRPGSQRGTAFSLLTICLAVWGSEKAHGENPAPPPALFLTPGAVVVSPSPAVERARTLDVDVSKLINGTTGTRLTLNLFNDATFIGECTHRAYRGPSSFTLGGHIESTSHGLFVISYESGVASAFIHLPGIAAYKVHTVPGGPYIVEQWRDDGTPSCGLSANDHSALRFAPTSLPPTSGCVDDGSIIDLFVFYTPAARIAEDPSDPNAIVSLIYTGEMITNMIYLNSEILSTSVRIVGTKELDYVEAAGIICDRNRLADPTDGFMDEAHVIRDLYGADVAVLIVQSPDSSARGWSFFSVLAGGVAFPELGFNVLGRQFVAEPLYTFAHELGHNQGCAHDWCNTTQTVYSLGSHGHARLGNDLPVAQRFRTIMDLCGNTSLAERIPFFANPEVIYNGGASTGVTAQEECPQQCTLGLSCYLAFPFETCPCTDALTIVDTAQIVANFRVADCNSNGVCDRDDIAAGGQDCNSNHVPDECEPDCDGDGVPNECESAATDCDSNGIPDGCEPAGDCNNNGVQDICDIAAGAVDCNQNRVPDSCESTADCDNNGIADICEAFIDCNHNAIPDTCDIIGDPSLDTNGNGRPDGCEPSILYVNDDATGLDDGTNWANAFKSLQSAIDVAASSLGRVDEIWVAAGIYRPTKRSVECEPRSTTFQLPSGVAVLGGFAGNEASKDDRNWATNLTRLSGDQNGDDASVLQSDCCYAHGSPGCGNSPCQAGVCLDQPSCCTDTWDESCELAALLRCCQLCGQTCDNSSHVVQVGNTQESPILDGFVIIRGYTDDASESTSGAGLFVKSGGSPLIRNCRFVGNIARSGAGAYIETGGGATFANCLFVGQKAGFGGAVSVSLSASATLVNSTVVSNSATGTPGVAISGTGGIWNQGNVTIRNGIVWGNSDQFGTGESAQISTQGSGNTMATYTCVQDSAPGVAPVYPGIGNIDRDPHFEDADGADDIVGTLDDNLQLESASPAVDSGNNFNVPQAADRDLGGNLRVVDAPTNSNSGFPPNACRWVDMGAYERQGIATIISSNPVDLAVDARQPNPVNNDSFGRLQGIGSPNSFQGYSPEPIEITLSVSGQALLTLWDLCETGAHPLYGSNSIQSVEEVASGVYRILLERPITPGEWTTIMYLGDGSSITYGFLPANVNGDGAANPIDILKIIDCLNNVDVSANCPYGRYSTDMDQSGVFNPADILRVIDLLNGADVFEIWNGAMLPLMSCCGPIPLHGEGGCGGDIDQEFVEEFVRHLKTVKLLTPSDVAKFEEYITAVKDWCSEKLPNDKKEDLRDRLLDPTNSFESEEAEAKVPEIVAAVEP